ncbi:hypothetical protein PZA11_003368 [Diplocarpon coronariae]
MVNSSLSNATVEQLSLYVGALNNTAVALAETALEEAKRRLAMRTEWTGIGDGGNGGCHVSMFTYDYETRASTS